MVPRIEPDWEERQGDPGGGDVGEAVPERDDDHEFDDDLDLATLLDGQQRLDRFRNGFE